MAQTVQRLELEAPLTGVMADLDQEKTPELPTNYLDSARLYSTPLSEQEQPVDWVSRLSHTQAFRQATPQRGLSAAAPPMGMYQHSRPARMVPARRWSPGAFVRRLTLSVILPALVLGGLGWALYTYVGTDWIGAMFTPATNTASPDGQTLVTSTGAQPSTGLAGVDTGITTAPLEAGTPAELRDRGVDAYRKGDYPESIRLLESAVAVGTDDTLTYYHLGLAYLAVVGRPHATDDAELAFRTAVSLQPDWAAAHKMLSESLIRGGFYVEAIGPALEATRLDPAMGEAWMTLGRAYKGAGKETEATQAYAHAARTSPPPPVAGP